VTATSVAVPSFVDADGRRTIGIEGRVGWCFPYALAKVVEIWSRAPEWAPDNLWLVFGTARGHDGPVAHAWVVFNADGGLGAFDTTLYDGPVQAIALERLGYVEVARLSLADVLGEAVDRWNAFLGDQAVIPGPGQSSARQDGSRQV